MKKFLVLSSWSRIAAIGSMLIVAFAVVGCDDSSSASAGPNDDPGIESSSSSSGKVTDKVGEPAEVTSSSSEKAKSSSSDTQSDAKQSSSSKKSGKSSSSSKDDASSSSVKSESSSSVEDSLSSSSDELSVSSSGSADVLSSSSKGLDWSLPKEAYLNPEIEYDTIIDSRDGKVYRTVKIGNQTWMAENLNFDPGQGGSGDAKYDWSWCYDDVPEHCDVAGRLYTWAAAIDSVKLANDADNPQECGYGKTCTLPDTVYGICPSGWHLPSLKEWEALYEVLTTGELKSQTGWNNNGNGTDASGFSAFPTGERDSYGDFAMGGIHAAFWSAIEGDRSWARKIFMNYYNDVKGLSESLKFEALSVRCVKN